MYACRVHAMPHIYVSATINFFIMLNQTTFGEKLVTKFMFDNDYTDEPYLPAPEQLKYKIIIKNKKILVDVPVGISSPR